MRETKLREMCRGDWRREDEIQEWAVRERRRLPYESQPTSVEIRKKGYSCNVIIIRIYSTYEGRKEEIKVSIKHCKIILIQ
jgi:hypothetical protein